MKECKLNKNELPDCEYQYNDIEIDNKGSFTILHEGKEFEVMFYMDFRARFGISQHYFETGEKKGKYKRLYIKGRKKLNSLVIVTGDGPIENDFISDESGKFTILHQDKEIDVMFVNQYAKAHQRADKQLVFYHLEKKKDSKSYMGKVNIFKVIINRHSTDQSLVLVGIPRS